MNEVSSNVVLPSQESGEPRVVNDSFTKKLALDVAGAAIFGALSIIISSFITPNIISVPGWGMAYFDPISLVWISSFLIFGFRCGLITTIIGSFGLMLFDDIPVIGPLMKFSATIWFILVPYLYLYIKKRTLPKGEDLGKLSNYIPAMSIAWLIRIPVMLIFNIVILKMWNIYDVVTLGWLGFVDISGFQAILITVVLLNTLQTLGDTILPYLLVYFTKIYDQFKIW